MTELPGSKSPSLALLHYQTLSDREYKTTIKSLFPLPDPDASPTSAVHPNSYDEYPVGSSVLGLYPDTSCFYQATVVAGPRDPPIAGARVSYYDSMHSSDRR